MKLARVIGTVVATKKDKALSGVKLLVIQPVTPGGKKNGPPLVAADTLGSGYEETIFYAGGKEGGMALVKQIAPVDAGVAGIIDCLYRPAGQRCDEH